MYCPECGNDIPEGTHYCPHCGKEQEDDKRPSVITRVLAFVAWKIFSRKVKQAEKPFKSAADYSRVKRAIGWYLAWTTAHFGVLLLFSNKVFTEELNQFWPLQHWNPEVYDFREFLFYTLFPPLILLIRSLVTSMPPEPVKPTGEVIEKANKLREDFERRNID